MATKAKKSKPTAPKKMQHVLIRTYAAGVHFGKLKATKSEGGAKDATLIDARRIWRWSGANTLNEIALRGIDVSKSRVSEPVAEITVSQVIEVIPLTDAAVKNLESAEWSK